MTARTRRPRGVSAPRTAVLATAVTAVLLSALTACGGEESDGPERTYVALGDSYVAAVGITPLAETTCSRSTRNYAQQITAALADTPQAVRLDDQSCAGAPISSLTETTLRGAASVPAQLDALDDSTDLVTIGMGGNEGGIFSTLVTNCPELRASDPTGAPCREAQQTDAGDRLVIAARGVRAAMTTALARIHDLAPQARVFVVGYPEVAPARGVCPRRLPLAAGDVAYFHELTGLINDALAAAAKAAGDTFIDAAAATRGHDICSDDPWVNGQDDGPDGSWGYHPRLQEQQVVAGLILEELGVTATPAASPSPTTP
ncbi:SGNH/GDSL hydrolase family protein [Nocardioides fonticola]|uniref:SGNH/GDSL hydrolase family protein n=1 Tax=Nocardioides fonticola TaxID=450363 RepID=UPI0031DC1561